MCQLVTRAQHGQVAMKNQTPVSKWQAAETEYVKDGHLRTVAVVLLIALGRMLVNQAKDGVVEMEIAKVIWAKQQLFAR